MLKKIELKNNTILLIGILLIITGVSFGFYEYFKEIKERTFMEMNILLYESEIPEIIEEESSSEEDTTTEEITSNEIVENSNNNIIKYDYIGILEIPKINLKRGFLDLNSIYNNVDYNITVINGSTFPNEENNNLILAAHSGNCNYCYFDKLYKLGVGDNAYINYNNMKYSYVVVDIYEVEKDGTVPIYRDYDKNVLTLITCTRNSNTKQTVYILESINNN